MRLQLRDSIDDMLDTLHAKALQEAHDGAPRLRPRNDSWPFSVTRGRASQSTGDVSVVIPCPVCPP